LSGNKHTIGILKNQWSSLHEIRLHLYERPHMKWHIKWIYCCIILHNMLAKLDNAWEEQVNKENWHPNNNVRIPQLNLKIGALKSRKTVSRSIMQEKSFWFPDCFSLILAIER
jgi:hypothetical protein